MEIEKIKEILEKGAEVKYIIEEKLHKAEIGPSGNRHTIYYKDVNDLKNKLDKLKKENLL